MTLVLDLDSIKDFRLIIFDFFSKFESYVIIINSLFNYILIVTYLFLVDKANIKTIFLIALRF